MPSLTLSFVCTFDEKAKSVATSNVYTVPLVFVTAAFCTMRVTGWSAKRTDAFADGCAGRGAVTEPVDPEVAEGDEGLFEQAVAAAAATTTAAIVEPRRSIIIHFDAAGTRVADPRRRAAGCDGRRYTLRERKEACYRRQGLNIDKCGWNRIV